MKNQILIFIALISFSCTSSNKNERGEEQIVTEVQEVEETKSEENESPIQEVEQNTEAFMNFFIKFMWDETFQKKHIEFPLIINEDTIKSKSYWIYNSFYTTKSYIPILYRDTTNLMLINNPLEELVLSVISYKAEIATNYFFNHEQKGQILDKIESANLELFPDIEFINFLKEFSSDSVFQTQHIEFPLPYFYADNDYDTKYDTLELTEWNHFKIIDSIEGMMSLNIKGINNVRHIYFRGVENGIQIHYIFRKLQGEWLLTKFEDYST